MVETCSLVVISIELRCKQCGDLWYTGAGREMIERGETCLTCGGELELTRDGAEPPTLPRKEP
jgi:hypothetical protein